MYAIARALVTFATVILLAPLDEGYAYYYSPGVMARVVEARGDGTAVPPLPAFTPDIVGYVARPDCAEVGSRIWITYGSPPVLAGPFLVADCGASKDQAHLAELDVAVEVSYAWAEHMGFTDTGRLPVTVWTEKRRMLVKDPITIRDFLNIYEAANSFSGQTTRLLRGEIEAGLRQAGLSWDDQPEMLRNIPDLDFGRPPYLLTGFIRFVYITTPVPFTDPIAPYAGTRLYSPRDFYSVIVSASRYDEKGMSLLAVVLAACMRSPQEIRYLTHEDMANIGLNTPLGAALHVREIAQLAGKNHATFAYYTTRAANVKRAARERAGVSHRVAAFDPPMHPTSVSRDITNAMHYGFPATGRVPSGLKKSGYYIQWLSRNIDYPPFGTPLRRMGDYVSRALVYLGKIKPDEQEPADVLQE